MKRIKWYAHWMVSVPVMLLLIVIVAVVLKQQPSPVADEAQPASATGDNTQLQTPAQEPAPEQPKAAAVKQFDTAALQAALDTWSSSQSGEASVVIADSSGVVLASVNPDQRYFAASIYKLFVVYEAYLRVDQGAYKLDEPYVAGVSLRECLDQIVRLSNTDTAQACAETLWARQGKAEQTERLASLYGLQNTSLVAITTTAADTAKMLARIESGADLSTTSRALYLESMKNQIHTQGFPSGIRDAEVFEKVGFNGSEEYHDAAILHLADGRSLIVAVLTNGVGASAISRLATALEATF